MYLTDSLVKLEHGSKLHSGHFNFTPIKKKDFADFFKQLEIYRMLNYQPEFGQAQNGGFKKAANQRFLTKSSIFYFLSFFLFNKTVS